MNKPIGEIVDLSHYQEDRGDVNFAKIKSAGILGVLLKATQGTTYNDPSFKKNIEEAVAQKFGQGVGAYHFADITSTQDAVAEANFFAKAITNTGTQYAVLDLERDSAHLSKAALTEAAKSFISQVKHLLGIKVGLYINLDYSKNEVDYTHVGADFLMLAQYTDPKKGPGIPCDIWQYTQSGNVPGVVGNIDRSFLYTKIISTAHTVPTKPLVKPAAAPVKPPVKAPAKPAPKPVVLGGIPVIGHIKIGNTASGAAIVCDKPSAKSNNIMTVKNGTLLALSGSTSDFWEVIIELNGKYIRGYVNEKFGIKQ